MFIFGYDKVLERLERVIQQLVELQTAEERVASKQEGVSAPPCWLVIRTVTLREYNKHRQSKSPQECSCGLSALHERIYRQTVDR